MPALLVVEDLDVVEELFVRGGVRLEAQATRRVTVPFSDIARIERSELGAGNTAGAGAATVAAIGVALGVVVGILAIWVVTRMPGAVDGPARCAVPESPRR